MERSASTIRCGGPGNPNNPTDRCRLEKSYDSFRNGMEAGQALDNRRSLYGVRGGNRMEKLFFRCRAISPSDRAAILTKTWRIPGLRAGFLATAGPIERLRAMQPPWAI